MFYREAANVKTLSRKYILPEITWLDSKYFKEIESKTEIKPCIANEDGLQIYIGKTVPYFQLYSKNPKKKHEIIGAVVKDQNGIFCLHVSYERSVYILKEDFLVLSIENENSYEWIRGANGSLPNYALRGSLDNSTKEFMYIGRVLQGSKGTYWNQEFQRYSTYTNDLTVSVGKLHPSRNSIHIPITEKVIAFKEYEVLCLKPSPASLIILCRLVIRKINQNNLDLGILKRRLPEKIMRFLAYPASLSYGEFLLQGEKILSECGKFELIINSNNELACRDKRNELSIVIAKNVESLYLHHNMIVSCQIGSQSFHVVSDVILNYKIIPNNYNLKINASDDENESINFCIDIFDNHGKIFHTDTIFPYSTNYFSPYNFFPFFNLPLYTVPNAD